MKTMLFLLLLLGPKIEPQDQPTYLNYTRSQIIKAFESSGKFTPHPTLNAILVESTVQNRSAIFLFDEDGLCDEYMMEMPKSRCEEMEKAIKELGEDKGTLDFTLYWMESQPTFKGRYFKYEGVSWLFLDCGVLGEANKTAYYEAR